MCIKHPDNAAYDLLYQIFLSEYHALFAKDIQSHKYHLLWPSSTSSKFTKSHKLTPYNNRIYIHHLENYIHGPFNFAFLNGHRMKDEILKEAWNILIKELKIQQ